jgi:hypothetical protein
VRQLDELVESANEGKREKVEEACNRLARAWAHEVTALGCEVKGLWLVTPLKPNRMARSTAGSYLAAHPRSPGAGRVNASPPRRYLLQLHIILGRTAKEFPLLQYSWLKRKTGFRHK